MFENTLTLNELFTLKNIVTYLIAINLIAFLTMWVDKKKAKKGAWRISEKALFILVILGGGIGGIAGMYTFRHKTQKPLFFIGFPLILILEIIIAIYYIT